MGIQNISLSRSIFSYIKVRTCIGNIKRGRRFFINHANFTEKRLLNIGCGVNVKPNFVNLDYLWLPNIDVCWDIEKMPYPFDNNRFEGIYTEHCLEHITLDACIKNINEYYRILNNRGVLRIIVPDGELYFDIYQQQKKNQMIMMPYQESYMTPMARINGLFRNHGHKFIYDYQTLEKILKEAGFREIKKTSYNNGIDSRLLIDSEARSIESLYVEAIK